MSEQALELLSIVAEALARVSIQDNTRPRPAPTDPLGMMCDCPPAYHVVVAVNWVQGYAKGAPWVSVSHTERFGIGPIDSPITFLEPPEGVDRDDPEAVTTWLVPELLAAVERHAPAAAKAKADDVGEPGPVEAWDAIRRLD